jgi:hypothetical protein
MVKEFIHGIGGAKMTDTQRTQIKELRLAGYGYTTIAKVIGLTKDNVKAYCRAHDLAGIKAQSNARITPDQGFCQCCGKPLHQIPGRKKPKFCSADCRQQWWNTHPEKVTRKAIYSFTCAYCGNLFTAYGNASRKYCCHNCYVAARFKGGAAHD